MPRPKKKTSLASAPPAGYPGRQELDAGKIANGFNFREVVTPGSLAWLFANCAEWATYFEGEAKLHNPRLLRITDPITGTGTIGGLIAKTNLSGAPEPFIIRANSANHAYKSLVSGAAGETAFGGTGVNPGNSYTFAWNGDPNSPIAIVSAAGAIHRWLGEAYDDLTHAFGGGASVWTGTHFLTSNYDMLVAGPGGDELFRSPDGDTWATITLAQDFGAAMAAADGAGNVCKAGTITGGAPATIHSADHGATWGNAVALPSIPDGSDASFFGLLANLMAVRSDGVAVLAAGRSSAPFFSPYYWHSTNHGQSWQAVQGPFAAGSLSSVLLVGDVFVALSVTDGTIHTSLDGLTWETSVPLTDGDSNLFRGAQEINGSLFIVKEDVGGDLSIYRTAAF